jgi:hypothetical protein
MEALSIPPEIVYRRGCSEYGIVGVGYETVSPIGKGSEGDQEEQLEKGEGKVRATNDEGQDP